MEELGSALAYFVTWPAPMWLFFGVLLGALFGILPGLGGPQVIALLTPLTYGMDPRLGVTFIIGAMGAVATGGSISAILVNTPGTGQNAATLLDGFPLTRKGHAGQALGASAMSGAMGGVFGALILLALVPVAKQVVMAFSYPEIFMMAIMGLSIIVVVSKGAMWKGFISAGAGLMLACVGMDVVTGGIRFTYGIDYLWDGVKLIPAVIGLFAIPEAVELFVKGGSVSSEPVSATYRDVLAGIKAPIRHWWLFLRCAVIGTIIGIIPGVGGAVATWVSYGHAVQTEKDKELFGTGDIRGVIAPESAVCAKDGGALVPTVAFGIPGSIEMAVLLGTLMLQGIVPGPQMILEHTNVVYSIIIALAASQVAVAILTIAGAKWLAKITAVPIAIVAPAIFTLCLFGAYATEGHFGDVVMALAIGLLAYAMKVYGFSRVPMVIALVLGEVMQHTFHQTLQAMGPAGFVTRPLALALLLITIAMVVLPTWTSSRKRRAVEIAR